MGRIAMEQQGNDGRAVGHVISLTHWDREWRYPIWEQRVWLVRMMDGLLDLLEREPRYRSYLLDGQCIPVEDYLAIRPEQRERVIGHVRAGRIQIGPWYTLPDQYPVDGECLVRNLLWGRRQAESYGGCMNIGFTTFGWGQIAQLPQIYAGFGIDFIVTAKRVSARRAPASEFWWQAPDGTRVLTTRLGEFARANFFFYTTLPTLFGYDYARDWRFHWEEGGLPYHRADIRGQWHEYTRLDQPASYHPEFLARAIEDVWHSTEDTTVKSHRFLGDGSDFTNAEPRVLRIIDDANQSSGERVLVHSSLPEYVAAVEADVDRDRLCVVHGELRDGPPEGASANALATRPAIKRLNRQVQHLLIGTAEPLAAAAHSLGAAYPEQYLDLAWRYLLLSQPHDSINGVTQDKTADDVRYRLSQAAELAEVTADLACQELVKHIDLGQFSGHEIPLVFFNSLPFPRREMVKVFVDTPREWDATALAVYDAGGQRLDCQPLGRSERTVALHEANVRPWPFYVDRHAFYLDTGDIPACGYKVVRVVPVASQPRCAVYWPAADEWLGQPLSPAPNVLENEHLRVVAQPNGTLDVLDKAAGSWHRGLHFFEDGGDVGDYWVRRHPAQDRVLNTQGLPARIWLEEQGALAATLVVELAFGVPACADRELDRRSSGETVLLIRTAITLRRGAASLEFATTVENTARDHRLRVFFPTDIAAEESCAEGHFHVDRRPIDPAGSPDNARWPDMWTYPQQSFVDVSDGRRGLALINDGLCEYEVLNEPRRTLALTLLRAVRNEICAEFRVGSTYPEQEGGQSLGRQEYRYALYFHPGDWGAGGVFGAAGRFNVPLMAVEAGPHPGQLPVQQSLFSLEPAGLVLSAFKRAHDRPTLIVRLFNPTTAPLTARLVFAASIAAARLVTLNEDPVADLPVEEGHRVLCEVGTEKIVTIELQLAGQP